MSAVLLTVLWLGGFSAVLMWGALVAERMMGDDD
jgi:hypothetical protein